MLKTLATGAVRAGKAVVYVIGLAVTFALIVGVAGTALAASVGDPFLLGKFNAVDKITRLVGTSTGAMLKVDNDDTTDSATALRLEVEPDNAPLSVNPEAGTATGLRAEDAAHADQADHATNATDAQNAAKLGGVAAADYVRDDDPRLGAQPAKTFEVRSNSSISWLIDDPSDYVSGSNVNPTLVLQRGQTYRFNVRVFGHPFRISSSASGPAFNTGVTNNDVMGGTLTITVPMDAPDTLYYYCLAHPNMNGVIRVS